MKIWHGDITLEMLNNLNKGTLGEFFSIEFTEIGDDYLIAKMPVSKKVMQPFGLLHGGASVALAETIGSVASWCVINREVFMGVGVEINASHIKAVYDGEVFAVCKAIKATGKNHVWDIQISDHAGNLCCVSRFLATVVTKPK